MISLIVSLLFKLVDAYTIILFVYVILSWIPNKSGIINDIDTVLGKICDPFLDIFRKFIPPIGGMLDISPIIALLALQLAERLILWILY